MSNDRLSKQDTENPLFSEERLSVCWAKHKSPIGTHMVYCLEACFLKKMSIYIK